MTALAQVEQTPGYIILDFCVSHRLSACFSADFSVVPSLNACFPFRYSDVACLSGGSTAVRRTLRTLPRPAVLGSMRVRGEESHSLLWQGPGSPWILWTSSGTPPRPAALGRMRAGETSHSLPWVYDIVDIIWHAALACGAWEHACRG